MAKGKCDVEQTSTNLEMQEMEGTCHEGKDILLFHVLDIKQKRCFSSSLSARSKCRVRQDHMAYSKFKILFSFALSARLLCMILSCRKGSDVNHSGLPSQVTMKSSAGHHDYVSATLTA